MRRAVRRRDHFCLSSAEIAVCPLLVVAFCDCPIGTAGVRQATNLPRLTPSTATWIGVVTWAPLCDVRLQMPQWTGTVRDRMCDCIGVGVVGAGSISVRGALEHLWLPDVQHQMRLAAACDLAPGRADRGEEAWRRAGPADARMSIEEL